MSDRERDSIQEMEDIQKGLEAFLQQEMREMQTSRPTPQMYDMKEEDEEEEELDVISSGRSSREDYAEDWDDPTYRRRQAQRRETSHREPHRETSHRETSHRETSYRETARRAEEPRSSEKQSGRKKRPKKKKRSGFKRFLISVALIIVFLAAGLYALVGRVYGEMKYEKIESVASSPMKEDGVTNILLIGNDSRENGEDGRSDAMILLSISNKTKKIYMTSLLRDMYVDIPGHKGNRLNAAYSYGGAELLMETIEQNFDIHISRYVLVNFEAFANLVDAVGGVDLELTSTEVEYVNGYLVEYNILLGRPEGTDYFADTSGGMVHLNGPQALAYCRNRYIGTDFGRTERQRKVLTEVIHNLPKGMVTNPKGLIDGLMPNLTTNLTQAECYQLSLMAPKVLSYEIIQNSIPLEGTYKDATIREMAVLEVDFDANKKFLQENLYGEE